MAQKQEAVLTLLSGKDITLEKLIQQYRILTGREPTQDEIEKSRQILKERGFLS